jgi:hypothetical protein
MGTQQSAAVQSGAVFASILLVMAGCFNVIDGLAAVVKGDSYWAFAKSGTLVFNVHTWGWILLIFGVVQVMAAAVLWSGALWARILGIAVAVLNAMAHLTFVGTYPFWSLTIIAVDILIIYALVAFRAPYTA